MADIVSRVYSNFRGCDFRGLEVNLLRSPDSLNVWKDYKETESIRTRPETKLNTSFTDPVYGVFFYNNEMLVHSGAILYKVKKDGNKTVLWQGLNKTVSNSFIYDDVWYFKDGEHYLKYDGTNISAVVDDAYIPTTTIARKPMGGGTKYEDVNMLSDYRKNSFLSDGASFSYFLDVMNIDEEQPEVTILNKKTYYSVTRNTDGTYTKTDTTLKLEGDVVSEMLENESGITTTGEKVYSYDTNLYCCIGYADTVIDQAEYTVDYKEGKIVFKNTPPDEPLTDGQDNVIVKFKKAVPKYLDSIMKCTSLQVFDNRVFFSGNPDHPNMMWNSSLNDPSYVSDLDYYKEGMDSAAIKGMVAGNNALWVFREPSDSNTTIFYHTPTLDEEYGKVYPSSHSSVTTGCIGKAINFNDDIVFFSERGMEGISGDITTEQVVSHRSSLVDSRLISEKGYKKNMVLAEWEGYLLIFIGNKVYLADSRAMFQNDNHYEYEFFYWELKHNVICATVKNGDLYIGAEDGGIYTLTDTTADVESYWVTPLDKFKYPHRQKTTNKKSCTVEAEGAEISVYSKTNKDTEFELLDTFTDVTDAFCCRIKKKKFKDIQLKFYSKKWFALETATLECFVGGYLKNL